MLQENNNKVYVSLVYFTIICCVFDILRPNDSCLGTCEGTFEEILITSFYARVCSTSFYHLSLY